MILDSADLVAKKPGTVTNVIEVEGDSTKQMEQALYSAIGQVVLLMKEAGQTRYGIAVPNVPKWERQLAKIPTYVRNQLSLALWLVGKTQVRKLE